MQRLQSYGHCYCIPLLTHESSAIWKPDSYLDSPAARAASVEFPVI